MKEEKEEFNISEWRHKVNEDLFAVDPGLTHKIWDLLIEELKWNDGIQDGELKFSSKFPTASGFANFLNEKLKGLTEDISNIYKDKFELEIETYKSGDSIRFGKKEVEQALRDYDNGSIKDIKVTKIK